MVREVTIHEVELEVLRDELRHVVQYFQSRGYQRCSVVFGWHWGMEYPPAAPWEAIHVALADVEAEIRKPEDAGLGEFGRDDVTIRVPPADGEFEFCHHGGIHLRYSQSEPIAKDFLLRWSSQGLSPVERDCTTDH